MPTQQELVDMYSQVTMLQKIVTLQHIHSLYLAAQQANPPRKDISFNILQLQTMINNNPLINPEFDFLDINGSLNLIKGKKKQGQAAIKNILTPIQIVQVIAETLAMETKDGNEQIISQVPKSTIFKLSNKIDIALVKDRLIKILNNYKNTTLQEISTLETKYKLKKREIDMIENGKVEDKILYQEFVNSKAAAVTDAAPTVPAVGASTSNSTSETSTTLNKAPTSTTGIGNNSTQSPQKSTDSEQTQASENADSQTSPISQATLLEVQAQKHVQPKSPEDSSKQEPNTTEILESVAADQPTTEVTEAQVGKPNETIVEAEKTENATESVPDFKSPAIVVDNEKTEANANEEKEKVEVEKEPKSDTAVATEEDKSATEVSSDKKDEDKENKDQSADNTVTSEKEDEKTNEASTDPEPSAPTPEPATSPSAEVADEDEEDDKAEAPDEATVSDVKSNNEAKEDDNESAATISNEEEDKQDEKKDDDDDEKEEEEVEKVVEDDDKEDKEEEVEEEEDDDDETKEEEDETDNADESSRRSTRKRRLSEVAPTPDTHTQKNKRFQAIATQLINQISSNRFASMFLQPVSIHDEPEYYKLIKNPQDLKTIQREVKQGKVHDLDELQYRIQLMFSNAVMYNDVESETYKWTIDMMKEAQNLIDLFKESIE